MYEGFWDGGQPDNYRGNENCAVTNCLQPGSGSISHPGKWNDAHCSNKQSFVCETSIGWSSLIILQMILMDLKRKILHYQGKGR